MPVHSLLYLLIITLSVGLILGLAAVFLRVKKDPTVNKIDEILPQTQCGQCGYPGCRPYAEAIAQGDAINKCPPGGAEVIQKLADLLNREPLPQDESHGQEQPPRVAIIREAECIGCTKCIQACPVDAIVGAAKKMHSVILDECTGCDLCIDPCPVDCIDMVEISLLNNATLPNKPAANNLINIKPEDIIASEARA